MRLSQSRSRDSGIISRLWSLQCGGSLQGRRRQRLWGPVKVTGRHLLLTLPNCSLLCRVFRSVIFRWQIQNSQSCRSRSPAPLHEETGRGPAVTPEVTASAPAAATAHPQLCSGRALARMFPAAVGSFRGVFCFSLWGSIGLPGVAVGFPSCLDIR